MTRMEFNDRHNGEELSIYEPGSDAYLYPPGTDLIFHISSYAAYLNHDDLVRLNDTLDGHLERELPEANWEALQQQIVASIRADILIGDYEPGWTLGKFFADGVKDSVASGIQAYRDKHAGPPETAPTEDSTPHQ